uniref:Uncharacterized protein n=1 Tax=Anopheles atroparvus TaxID=41427 RepID=A0A182JL08_ANOAO
MGFKHLITVKANEVIPVHKYRSDRTGLTVIVGEVEGPVVNGYFTLATEARDDDGLPHTLEHLIFLGSEKYPYKGILDLVANRCLASGTNAWTDRDHTCYTMTTAGSEGFLALLPVYLDHILYPTLTDSGFITEVHHITGEGEDAGVVYCEMQGRENTGESRVNLEMVRAMYPNCGYSAETGGILSNLRISTTNEKVRAYHASFYRPDNLYVIITGQIKPDDIFKAIEPIEEKIISKGKLPPFSKPWETPVEPLAESKNIKIHYPADEEDCGLVNVAWRGPMATSEYDILTSCSVILRYLTDTSASPVQREFIENHDPDASRVSYSIVENSVSLLYISFENVPLGKEDNIFPKLAAVLATIAQGSEKLDMQRMRNVIERYRLEALSSLESNPHDDIAFHVIGDVLYGFDESELKVTMNTEPLSAELRPYLVLLLELLTESPVRRGDVLIPYEEVVSTLESNTVETATELGFASSNRFSVGAYSSTATLHMQVVREKYATGINLIIELLHKTEFNNERIKVCATKLINEVAQAKREGNSIAKDILKAMRYRVDSNVRMCSLLKQSKFLTTLVERMEDPDMATVVIAHLNKARAIMTQPENLAVHMAADWDTMKDLGIDLSSPWKELVPAADETPDFVKRFVSIQDWKHMMSEEDTLKPLAGVVVGLGSVESAFLFRTCRSIIDFNDPDYVPLLLFLQYLTQLEGPLWRQIRGQGFAYGYNIVPRPNEGLLYFTLYRASNVVAAFKEAESIMEKQLNAYAEWDSTLLESARSSLIFEIIARENSIEKVVHTSMLASFKQVPAGFNQSLVRQVGKVTKEDLVRVGNRYVKDLFSTSKTCTAIVCHPDKASDVAKAFESMGYSMKVETSLEESVLA